MRLYPHQDTGADWLAPQKGAVLGDLQGLGKTITAITATDRAKAKRVLCVVPTVVLWNWAREWSIWSSGRTVQIIEEGTTDLSASADVVVVTHGLLIRPWIRYQLVKARWSVCILDEAHFFRNPGTKRTKAFYGTWEGWPQAQALVARAARTWVLSGTIAPNGYQSELWAHVFGLAPKRIARGEGRTWDDVQKPMSHAEFEKRYCVLQQTRYGTKVVGNKHTPELKERLRGFMLRRTDEVDLPSLRFEELTLRPETMPQALKDLDSGKLGRELRRIFDPDDPMEFDLAGFETLRKSTDYSRFRRLCGLAKADAVADLLKMELEHGGLRKVVVFAHHRDVLTRLRKQLLCGGPRDDRCIVIDGSATAADRTRRVASFQESDWIRVALCQIVAGGTGITLTASQDVVFCEMSFVPGENEQAFKRCHRIGQTKPVRVRCVALAGTVDADVTATLRRKVQMIREMPS